MYNFSQNTEIAPNMCCIASWMCSRNALDRDDRVLLKVQTATIIHSVTISIMLSVNLKPDNRTMLDNAKTDSTIEEIREWAHIYPMPARAIPRLVILARIQNKRSIKLQKTCLKQTKRTN